MMFALSKISLQQLQMENVGIDDANIFFVYAKNFAEGHGFVYNTGGERVEGFSSMLWTLVLAGVFLIFSEPEPAILCLNLLFGAVTLSCLVSFIEEWISRSIGKPIPSFLGFSGFLLLAWSLVSPGFVIWTTITLMENGLWTMLAVLVTLQMLKFAQPRESSLPSRISFALLLALVILCRPEGMLWSAVLLSCAFLGHWLQDRRLGQAFKEVIIPASTCVFTVIGLFIFRIWYFGYPFPNTYYAKVSPDRAYNLIEGAKYSVRFHLSHWVLPVLTLVIVLGVWKLSLSVFRRIRFPDTNNSAHHPSVISWGLISAVLLVGGIIPILVGGDHFQFFRFYQVVWPMLPLPLLMFVGPILAERINLSLRPKTLGLILVTGLLLILPRDSWFDISPSHRIRSEFNIVKRDRALGDILNLSFTETDRPSIGVVAAGAIALVYDGKVIDMMGLNNLDMAHAEGDRKGRKNHAAFNKDVLLRQSPEILTPFIVESVEILATAHKEQLANSKKHSNDDVLKGLRREQRFLDAYQLGALRILDGKLLGGWFRRDYIESLSGRLFYPIIDS
jgi:arabinofuranosyltransferase